MSGTPHKRVLPKLMACITKTSLENLRNKALFGLNVLDAKGIRRRKLPLHECLTSELRESGFVESSNYLLDLLYDNMQLMAEDDIGIVVDLRTRKDFLEHICLGLQKAEREKDKGNSKAECIHLLNLGNYYADKGKGILWLAEKFFQASLAVSSQYLIDGGAQKARCKYHYAKFLLDKFPGADPEEPFQILTNVRDNAIGKDWLLFEEVSNKEASKETVFIATAIQLHRVLMEKSRLLRKKDTGKSERLARLAERRAKDAGEVAKMAEAIIDIGVCQLMMNNLNNAKKTLQRAFQIHTLSNNAAGICETKMHMAAVMQKLGNHEAAAKLLTEMGALAMERSLRSHLGRALHLLGELHLRREKPELGTHHLAEAFACFMGIGFTRNITPAPDDADDTELQRIYSPTNEKIFVEEAEQSRLMMAISAGQELMASYFNTLREANVCNVAQMKIIEWKLNKAGWWIRKLRHDTMPCMCPVHNRTPLDCLRVALESRTHTDVSNSVFLQRIDTESNMLLGMTASNIKSRIVPSYVGAEA